ncbi:hypothetical protein GCM10008983_17620 [Lentibacillus halophilus]|uniref:DUF4357 domain-containing protein n=2 Tax=Lentibacillus halophilus TaxID=295065 RepID=A0ABN0ZA36_9BACI
MQGNYYISQENITFSSPSTASSLLIERSSNGLIAWKLTNGETLKEVLNK